MPHLESKFTVANQEQLFVQAWKPQGEAKAVIAVVHGIGEHSGRYAKLAARLTARHYTVCAFDHRGHGQSPGPRGHINAWAEYRADVQAFLEFVRAQNPGLPIFLMGHSMGGVVVLDYALRHPEGCRGVISSSAGLDAAKSTAAWKVTLAKVMSGILPRFSMDLGLDVNAISRDPAEVKLYEADPLVHSKATARWGAEFLAAGDWVMSHASDWQPPLLMLHGDGDRIANVAGSRNFFKKVTCPDKTLKVYPGAYHEIHNDNDRDQEFADLTAWLDERIGQ